MGPWRGRGNIGKSEPTQAGSAKTRSQDHGRTTLAGRPGPAEVTPSGVPGPCAVIPNGSLGLTRRLARLEQFGLEARKGDQVRRQRHAGPAHLLRRILARSKIVAAGQSLSFLERHHRFRRRSRLLLGDRSTDA